MIKKAYGLNVAVVLELVVKAKKKQLKRHCYWYLNYSISQKKNVDLVLR